VERREREREDGEKEEKREKEGEMKYNMGRREGGRKGRES
jgi:hypothetical protein